MALESAGGSIIAMLAELMVEPVGRQFRYMFCFNNFAQEFKEQKENLVSAKERLQDDVEAAERNAEKTYKDVKKWLEDANNQIEGAKPLENEIGKNGKCFTWCPNCMRQFKLSKALAKKSETFRKILENSTKFKIVAQKAPPQPIEFLTSKEFTPSESSQEALEQIMKVLKDDNVNMIGLYGMGGVGKTTLVKEVGRRAKESQLFPEVLMATVSQNPNFIGIQDRMADSLHLKFEKTSKEGRASELWRKYDIILGNWFVVANYGYPTSTRLILAGTSLNAKTFEQLFLHKLESVQVSSCGDVFTLFPAKLRQGLKNLKEVIVDSCKSLEEVFELGEADEQSNEEKGMPLLSSLTELQLEMLPKLKCIWKGPTGHASLQSLNLLNLNHLDKLIFIFTPSLARSLPKLETLNIRNCGELKHIIREEDCDREIIPESPCFPKLKTISISDCGKLEYVLPVSVSPSLPNLEQMWILNAHNLKQIFYNVEGDALTRDGIIKFPELRELSISNCSFFGPKKFAAQLPSLQILEINGHKELGNLFAQLQGLTNLEKLRLESVPDMGCIWKGLVLSKLTTLEVVKCKRLTHVFTCSMIASLVQLEVLKIFSCEELEQIIARDTDDENDQILLGDHLRSLCFPNLCEIEIRDCNKLKSLFPVAMASGLPNLQILSNKSLSILGSIWAG